MQHLKVWLIFKLLYLSCSFWSRLEPSSLFHNQWKINWQDIKKKKGCLTNQQHLSAKELMENDNLSNGAVSQGIIHSDKSRKLHYARQVAWNLPVFEVVSGLSLTLEESPRLSLRSGLAPYTQRFMGGQGKIPFKFSVSLIFRFDSANHKSFRQFFFF